MNSFHLLSDNLISWWIQVSAIAALGATLPWLFRIRYPKAQLAFLHFILAVCILLPLIEPWQHPLILANGAAHNVSQTASEKSWVIYLGWVIAAGIFVKLCWLAGGLWQIRRFRVSAIRIFPIPESIRQARTLTHADARFGISRNVDSPATLGHVDPIILLPESFLSLSHDAQLSIVCHELIHVRRYDWLVTLFEEIIGAVFWFTPAMRLLQSQIKLNREQLVDSEVVVLTEAPAPYVQALLAMAGAPGKLKTVPAAFFLTDGHLPHRVRSLLTNRRGSIGRLAGSYVLIACLLAVSMMGIAVRFPLIGKAQAAETAGDRRLLPRTLVARTKPVVIAEAQTTTFNVAVPVSETTKDAIYYVSGTPADPAAEDQPAVVHEVPSPPPPPPMFQPFERLESQGIRMVRPGDRLTPEDIARMQSALGERTLIEVIQTEDGTVQRISIQRRRSPDEISVGPLRFGFGPGGFFSAGPAGAADSGIH